MLLFGFAEETNKIDRDFRSNHDHITIVEQKESKFK